MRFAGSVYDLLRQRGLRDHFASLTVEQTRRRLLSRLRFDDLFSCQDPSDLDGSRIVVSASDVIEGPLFVFLEPEDLTSLSLEVCVPSSIVSTEDPVARLVRSWIQNEDGTGRPFILNLLPSVEERVTVREEVQKRRNLNIRTVGDAVDVIRATGLAAETVAEVHNHWWKWRELLAKSANSTDGPRLAPYRQPASAVRILRAFREAQQKHEGSALELSREFGQPCFNEALALLEAAGGRRDVVVAYFDQQEKTTYAVSDRAQLAFLRAVFAHYMFRAVASGNDAVAEHSAKVSDADVWALSNEQFDVLVSTPSPVDAAHRLSLPERIMNALADLSAAEYATIRNIYRPGIAIGMSEFLRTRQIGPLERAMEKLARHIVSGGQAATPPDQVARTMVFPLVRLVLALGIGAAAGAAAGATTDPIMSGAIGGALGAIAGGELPNLGQRVVERPAMEAQSWLLKRSFVRRVEEEKRPGAR